LCRQKQQHCVKPDFHDVIQITVSANSLLEDEITRFYFFCIAISSCADAAKVRMYLTGKHQKAEVTNRKQPLNAFSSFLYWSNLNLQQPFVWFQLIILLKKSIFTYSEKRLATK
jgi:hypothetical protein